MTTRFSVEEGIGSTSTFVRMHNAKQQVLVIGVLAFCGPGLFNALNGLGNAGSSDPTVAAIANTALYFTFAASGYFASAFLHILGPIPLFTAGGFTYAVYALCIYYSTLSAALPILGGIILGWGAGLFWTAQSSLMNLYGTPHSRGRLIALFWIVFNAGGVMGGLLQFVLNFDNVSKGATSVSYFTFIALMLTGALMSPFVIASPSTVVRDDGSHVQFELSPVPLTSELRAAFDALRDPFVQRSIPFWIASNWFYTYDFSGFNGHQFNMRTRGLNSALFWAAQMVAAWLFGKLLDSQSSPLRRASRGLWYVICLLFVSMALALQSNFYGGCNSGSGWDKDQPCTFDFAEDGRKSCYLTFVYMLLGASDAIYQNYALWLIATMARGNARKTVAYSSAYKGFQSLGAGMAWAIDFSGLVSYGTQGLITLVISAAAALPVLLIIAELDTKRASDV